MVERFSPRRAQRSTNICQSKSSISPATRSPNPSPSGNSSERSGSKV